jgi:ELWxxDGT repeat protein
MGEFVFVSGAGLWKTDGSAAGTTLVTGYGAPYFMTAGEHILYFWLDFFGDRGPETWLWRSDGTAEGTFAVEEIDWGAPQYDIVEPVAAGDLLFFTPSQAYLSLCRSDGSIGGRRCFGAYQLSSLTPVGKTLYFQTGGAPYFDSGGELWFTDGTTAHEVMRFSELIWEQADLKLGDVNGTLLFGSLLESQYVGGLWRSDGTTAGTVQLQEFFGPVGKPVAAGRLTFFPANDQVTGVELWVGRTSVLTARPLDAIRDLQKDLLDLQLRRGIAASLEAKLRAAAESVEKDKRVVALLQIEAFTQEVEAQRGKAIPSTGADRLIEFAGQIMSLLGDS